METVPSTNVLKISLLQKLACAVTCSVLSHVVLLLLYATVVNLMFEEAVWFQAAFDTVTSFRTWLYFIPYCCIIFASVVVCANVYMLKSTYHLTRFQKLISLFSPTTFILCSLHIIIGGGEVWLYLFISKGQYKDVYVKCNEHYFCLREKSFFLILSGIWIGLYYFIHSHVADRGIKFPVIQQWKIQQCKEKFLPLIKQSCNYIWFPTLCYFLVYYLFGTYIGKTVSGYLQVRLQTEDLSIYLCISVWVFAVFYVLNMNLMRFFFELFLTEPLINIDNAALSEALRTQNIPVLQHLACLDLYLLSKWSPQRRQALFTLSQPGAHPHAWNNVFQAALHLLLDFGEMLKTAIDGSRPEEQTPPQNPSDALRTLQSPIQSPLIDKYRNMNNMAFVRTPEELDQYVEVAVGPRIMSLSEMVELVTKYFKDFCASITKKIKNIKVVKYFFGEIQEAHVQQCLKNGQLIIWTSQGLANIAVASFNEDPYGIVQKDLPILIRVLVELKQTIDRLNKLPMFSRRANTFDYSSYKMKNSVSTGVKLSLGNICNTFGKYINDLALPKDVASQLQCYI